MTTTGFRKWPQIADHFVFQMVTLGFVLLIKAHKEAQEVYFYTTSRFQKFLKKLTM